MPAVDIAYSCSSRVLQQFGYFLRFMISLLDSALYDTPNEFYHFHIWVFGREYQNSRYRRIILVTIIRYGLTLWLNCTTIPCSVGIGPMNAGTKGCASLERIRSYSGQSQTFMHVPGFLSMFQANAPDIITDSIPPGFATDTDISIRWINFET